MIVDTAIMISYMPCHTIAGSIYIAIIIYTLTFSLEFFLYKCTKEAQGYPVKVLPV
jgi:uncharacterized protein (DUF697 family)